MRKRYLIALHLIAFLCLSGYARALNVLVTEDAGGVYSMPARWQSVLTAMGHTVNIQPISVLDNNSFFATTNVLIVSDGTATYSATQVNTIRSFLQSGKPVYLQSEYQNTYGGNTAFAQIVSALGSSFTWGATQNDDQNPDIFGTFATTNNAVPSLPYFWYGCTGTAGANIFTFIKSTPGDVPIGWCFCPANTSYGKLITTTDQDWIQNTGTYPIGLDLMENIFTHLITPGLCGSAAASPLVGTLAAHTNVSCNGGSNGSATVSASGGTTPYTYAWSPGGGTGVTASGLPAATYRCIITDAGGQKDTVIVTITEPAAINPVISSSVNPTTCGGTDGSITLSGLTASTTYTVNFNKNGTPQGPLSMATNGSGVLTINNLGAGSYTNITVGLGGCTSLPDGPVTLSNPAIPATPSAGSNSPVCQGSTLNLSTAAVGGATYSWTGPGFTSAAQSPSISNMQPAQAGTYTVTVTVAGCTSSPGTVNVVVTPPAIPSAAIAANPGATICSGVNVTFTATPVNGGTPVYQWRKNGVNVGTNSATYADNGLANGDIITVRLTSTATCRTLDTVNSPATTMTVNNVPAQPGVLTGNSKVCAGSLQSYSIGAVSNTTSYTWTLPPGWTGASNTTSINATVGSASGTGTLSVTANNGCGSSLARTLADTVVNIPGQPGVLTGNTKVCGGSSQSYSIAAVNEATGYTWTLPSGWSGSSTTTSINATAAAASGTGVITVTAGNFCGTSLARTLVDTVINTPVTPGPITGNVNICAGSAQSYSIATVGDAASYIWAIPGTNGWSGSSAGNSINTTAGTVTGPYTITVKATNQCGTSAVQSLNVNVSNIPGSPGAIAGGTNVCAGTAQPYSIAAVAEATSYTWTIPGGGSGWSATGPVTSSQLNTIAGTQSGTITVTAGNFCGTSPVRTLNVTVTNIPGQPGAITGNTNICAGSLQPYSVGAVPQATGYTWTIPQNGWTATGATGTTVQSTTPDLSSTAGTAGGTILVTAGNFCGTSPARTLNVTVTNIPGRPGIVSGPDSLCAGAGGTWSIGYVNEATGYVWTIPSSGGWTGTSTTQTLNASSGAVAPGGASTITVSGTNFCGTGPAATRSVWITRPVVPTLSLSGTNPAMCSGQPITFTATSTGGGANPTYQWRVNGMNTGSATPNPVFTSNSLANGDVVSVVLGSSALCATPQYLVSTGIVVQITPTVTPGVNINANRASNTLCAGTPVVFTATPLTGGGLAPSYQWRKNGTNVGTGGTTYTDAGLTSSDSVSVIMTSSAACVTSATAQSNKIGMVVSPLVSPSVVVSASPGTAVSAGTVVTFTATVTDGGANPGYQWLKNSRAIAGATGRTYTTNNLRNGDVISVQVRADQVCVSGGTTITSAGTTMLISTDAGSMHTAQQGSIRLYPNPNGGRFTVSVRGGTPNRQVQLEVLGVLGQVVSHTAVTPDKGDWSVDMDLGDAAAAGVYLLRLSDVQDGHSVQVQRFEVIK